ncbi:MAG TPA: M28 family peptidase [Candidatus Kapabacteria bacterium]|nr:M28 family peptidase [Candidatus Kapabacteria bacterium]
MTGVKKISSIALAAFLAAFISCSNNNTRSKPAEQQTSAAQAAPSVPSFDGDAAFRYLVRQVDFGSRAPMTAAHDSCLAYLTQELSQYTSNVALQQFTVPGYNGVQLNLTNVIASFNPKATQRVMLCAHWDSRPRADEEKDTALQSKAIPGANDGASGVGVLLELARIFKDNPPPMGVDIILFDGEDYGKETDIDNYCLGSSYFAGHLPAGFHPECGVLLDMVGDKDAIFRKEETSMRYANDICNEIWGAAQMVHATTFVNAPGDGITDDHVPLNAVGIPTVDIIDAELVGNRGTNPRRKYWHTLRDTPDQCSPATLHDVGATLLEFLYTVLPRQ